MIKVEEEEYCEVLDVYVARDENFIDVILLFREGSRMRVNHLELGVN